MSATDRAYERLVDANPVPDPERHPAAVDLDVDGVRGPWDQLDSFDEAPVRRPIGRWLIAAAMFAAVILAGGAALIASGDVDEGSVAAPIDVVEQFFDRWNGGDTDGALALLDPGASVAGATGVSDLRGLMEWSVPFDGVMETRCSSGSEPESVICDWAWRTAAADALGLEASSGRFDVEDGLIVRIDTPNYGLVELRLGTFAAGEDPTGLAEACTPVEDAPMSSAGFSFTERCGRFLAGLEAAFVASLAD